MPPPLVMMPPPPPPPLAECLVTALRCWSLKCERRLGMMRAVAPSECHTVVVGSAQRAAGADGTGYPGGAAASCGCRMA